MNLPDSVAYGLSTGGSISIGLVALRLLFGRMDKREAHLDVATKELIDELRKELNRLKDRADEAEEQMRECERLHRVTQEELNETRGELLKVQRLLQAGGEIRNRIQTGMAAEKLLGDKG